MRRVGIILALFFATISYAEVYTPEEVPNPKSQGQEYYVSNPDGILSDSTVNWVNGCAARLEQETEVELCVVMLESIGEEDAFDFAYELFQRWGIGKKGKNTGVLILFAGESHDLRIMTGTGIEGVLTDGICSKIMHEEMFPSFREGDYDMGICLGVLAIYDVCTDGETPEELQAVRSVTNRGRYGEEEDEEGRVVHGAGTIAKKGRRAQAPAPGLIPVFFPGVPATIRHRAIPPTAPWRRRPPCRPARPGLRPCRCRARRGCATPDPGRGAGCP